MVFMWRSLYVYVYSIPIHTGKGEEDLTRENVRGATVHKAGTKIPP
jgi:hypothetical protein